jgi:hypothetical protein
VTKRIAQVRAAAAWSGHWALGDELPKPPVYGRAYAAVDADADELPPTTSANAPAPAEKGQSARRPSHPPCIATLAIATLSAITDATSASRDRAGGRGAFEGCDDEVEASSIALA